LNFLTRSNYLFLVNTNTNAKEHLKRHSEFWRPVIKKIIETLIVSKSEKSVEDKKKSIIFVLWGGYAQKLEKTIKEIQKSKGNEIKVEFVKAKHPSVESFHEICSFDLIENCQNKLGQTPINWFIKEEEKILIPTKNNKLNEIQKNSSTLNNSSIKRSKEDEKEEKVKEIKKN